MALVRIEKQLISDIADAVREKVNIMSNTEVPFTKETYPMTPAQIADVIGTLPIKGKPELVPEEALLLTENCENKFRYGWKWFLEQYATYITTKNISSLYYTFQGCNNIKAIPFDLNFNSVSKAPCQGAFYNCNVLESIGKIKNAKFETMSEMFYNCYRLRDLPEFENCDFSYLQSYNYAYVNSMFKSCFSLRKINEELLKEVYSATTYSWQCHLSSTFSDCASLDEIRGINNNYNLTYASNMFSDTFRGCRRIKEIIFATNEDGTPKVAAWNSQTIDLVPDGYAVGTVLNDGLRFIINYNSGITADKEVIDDATYQALKNNPDWFTQKIEYSRYNHDSAVNTINSLPDTSAYLASAGGTNTIKFKGAAGSKTDGGAINTLTEAEIAVATAKGWTVTFV